MSVTRRLEALGEVYVLALEEPRETSVESESENRERIRDYLGEIRNLRSKIIEFDDRLQTLIAAGTIAGIFAIYLGDESRAFELLIEPRFGMGNFFIAIFGLFLILKIAEYFFTRRAIDHLEDLFVTYLYSPDDLDTEKFTKAQKTYKFSIAFNGLVTVIFTVGLLILIGSVAYVLYN
ncbi:MAG: hypothetical protein K2Q06_04085 [Parvularculaceae bacterium]|nr:hypothetical protein [Parvularculaceae bacterium]